MRNVCVLLLLALPTACATVPPATRAIDPVVDYHQHLVSPAFHSVVKLPQRDGAALVRELKAAGIERGVVLSVGYSFADERKGLPDPDRSTREENDWTSAQVVQNSPHLIGFCSANPLRKVALQELERCLSLEGMVGIKQHLGNAGVSLRNPEHLRRMQQVFALAEQRKVPVLVHARARGGNNYGAEDAHVLLQLAGAAPTVEIVVAHLGSSGPGYTPQHGEVLAVFAGAMRRRDPGARNLYVDLSGVVNTDTTLEQGSEIAARIRQIGVRRFLYGSDLTPAGGSIRNGWALFRAKVPLTARELQTLARNRTRFVRQSSLLQGRCRDYP